MIQDVMKLLESRKAFLAMLPLSREESDEFHREYPERKMENGVLKRKAIGGLRVTWLGHSSMIVEIDGLVCLVDPVLSKYASPMYGLGPKRVSAPPVRSIKELKDIGGVEKVDVVLLSHAHYDHVDLETLKEVEKVYEGVVYYVGWGMGRLLRGVEMGVDKERVKEMVWWESVEYLKGGKKWEIVFTPAQHWSRMGLFDMMTSLHGGFVVKGRWNRFLYTGDSGWCEVFKEIGNKLGPFNLAAIPIGAYEPRWLHAKSHFDPEEAVKVHKDVKAKRSVGVHWGTFRLTTENLAEPPRLLEQQLKAQGVPENHFGILDLGVPQDVVV